MSDENFLSRWSRRKREAKVDTVPEEVEVPSTAATPVAIPADSKPAPEPLPPIESLTSESDFTPFMKVEVDPALKRQAFKKLIEDPQFNVMDGLDVYIDDYSKPDPLPEGWLEKMNQLKHLGIFKEPAEGARGEVEASTEPSQKAIAGQKFADAERTAAADTSGEEMPPPELGKSGTSAGGI
jgi:Protein of unknown function (DUF3306)